MPECGRKTASDPQGTIPVMPARSGGKGSQTQLTQAAAEEWRVEPTRIRLVMADTA